ncbi:hypothetical protein ACIGG6_09675 [Vreelandella lionensis]|jgi:hypothetical protein|uniref:Uncharacterized protein n=1 Tax=Vreelandella lionensis TaxID=1144478 RepID=A0ABW8BSQ8_9GAMM|nr:MULTISPECIES: hypothetical protein [Halomonas]MCP1317983.1 hypothetical protein [Halomonas sp. 707B3]
MPLLTQQQEEALVKELVEVVESFQKDIDSHPERYEAFISQPNANHLVIKLQPITKAAE